jgi:two-component system sensor histidine kinase RegB
MTESPVLPALYATYLRHLLHLRLVALGGQALAYLLVATDPHVALPALPLLALGITLLAHTLLALRRLETRQGLAEARIVAETAVDLLSLTASLYLTGGANNPLVSLLLLPVTVATATLRPGPSWGVAGTAAACFTFLMFVHRPFPMGHHVIATFELHLWGMWYGFLLSAMLVALFVSRIGATLRAHDRALARAREQQLRNQQWVALGTLATGTAHELGTPLSTMAVLAADLEDDVGDRPELAEQVRVLRTQVRRCKGILARMARDAGEIQADAGRPVAVDEFLSELMDEWRAIRPEARVDARWRGARPAPRIVADRSLTQAIHNILNNAADACPERVDLEARWDARSLTIEVCDQGAGFAAPGEGGAAPAPGPGSPDRWGLGLGLLLTRTVLERLGGEVVLSPRRPSGVHARISLPLAPLLATREP